jgi:hypothetical protein
MRWRRIIFYFIEGMIILLILFYLVRFFSERQIDDVSPEISCNKELLEKADVLYIIPKFNNKSILNNKGWCEWILGLNKKLSLHGVYHTYNEFDVNRNEKYFQDGLDIFRECFKKNPVDFKPPQLEISDWNKKMIKEKFGLESKELFNQLFHKVYHCDDTGIFSNRFIDWF